MINNEFRLVDEGDKDANLWIAIDANNRAIASGRDDKKVAREAHLFLEREAAEIQELAKVSFREVYQN